MLQPLRRNEHLGWQLPVQKYRNRGYVFEVKTSALQSRRNHPMQKFRKAGDKFSWRIPLNTENMDVPAFLDPVPEDEYIYITEENSDLRLEDHFLLADRVQDEESRAYHYEGE